MSGGSRKVIIISLMANMGIAASKFGGAILTGSASLMAEAVHSLSDCGNQALLLYGQSAAKKPPTPLHPLGLGKEAFFWSFVVALLLFSMGGMFSIYEGWHKISHPGSVSSPWVGIVILLIAIGLETFSFWKCYVEVKVQNRFGSLWQWVRKTTSSDLLVIFLEDLAALLGLILAFMALLLTWITGDTFWDGFGSLLIGVLLVAVAFILAREVKSLLIGEMPSHDYRPELERVLQEAIPGGRFIRFVALQQGVDAVMLAYKINPGAHNPDTQTMIRRVNDFEEKVKTLYPEVQWQFAELDNKD
ncbi:MAG: cation transporter [Alphaproteobacteria bacterium]